MDNHFDALVVGSGVGGTCTAARLAKAGYRVLLAEALERVGGRASTKEVGGFLLNTGGFAIERGGMVDQTRTELGMPLDLYVPDPETMLVWGNKHIKMSSGLTSIARNTVPGLLNMLCGMIPYFKPKKGETVHHWLNRFTKNTSIHQLVDNVNCSFFAATNHDLQADVFLHYLAKGSSFKKIGFVPGGTIEVWKPMAEYVEKQGGEVWLNAPVERFTTDGSGLVNGAIINKAGETVSVSASLIVSNAGPLNTVRLAGKENFPAGYAETVEAKSAPAAIITLQFISEKDICPFPGLALGAITPQLSYAANFSAPELKRCPTGWNLYIAACTPRPTTFGEFDLDREVDLLKRDVKSLFPGFEQHARILDVDVTAHDWPAQRAVTGFDFPNQTPIANLWDVGDGTKPWGDAGTASCAETAKIVVEDILARYPIDKIRQQSALQRDSDQVSAA